MTISRYYNNFLSWREAFTPTLELWANHLIVIFAFSMPIIISTRRSALFIIALLFLIRGNFKQNLRATLRNPVVFAFTAYFLVHVIWLLGTDDWMNAKKTIHDAMFLLYPLLFVSFIDKRFIPRMLGAFFLGMFVSELLSYGIFFEIVPPMPHDGSQGTPADPTPIYHHTHYGFMLAVTLTLILQRFFLHKDTGYLRIFLLVFFVTASINIFITAGRTGYVLYGVLLLTLMLLHFRKKIALGMAIFLPLLLVAFTLAYQFSDTFHQRSNKTITSLERIFVDRDYRSSLGIRAAILVHNADVVKQHWLLGLGTGDQRKTVISELNASAPELGKLSNLQHPHNEYINALLQFGILGLIIFLNIPFQLYRYSSDTIESTNALKILATGILAFSIIDIFVIGLAALLTTVTLVSLFVRHSTRPGLSFQSIQWRTLIGYLLGIITLYFV